jgi:hypothetical protein
LSETQDRSRPCPTLPALASTRPRPSSRCTASRTPAGLYYEPTSAARKCSPSSGSFPHRDRHGGLRQFPSLGVEEGGTASPQRRHWRIATLTCARTALRKEAGPPPTDPCNKVVWGRQFAELSLTQESAHTGRPAGWDAASPSAAR